LRIWAWIQVSAPNGGDVAVCKHSTRTGSDLGSGGTSSFANWVDTAKLAMAQSYRGHER
jgi:hypothetical protein